MIVLSWSTFRERWQLLLGALVAVCLGVALVQCSLLILIAAATPQIPSGLSYDDELSLRSAYTGAVSLSAIIVVLTIFVAVFVVGSTFAFTVAQRRQDLALLRLVGASRRQVRRLLLGEAVLLGVLGTAAGILLGLLLVPVEAWLFRHFGFVPPDFVAPWHVWVLYVSLASGVCMSVMGCLAASRRAGRVRPLEALRDVGGSENVMTASRWIIGTVATVVAAALVISTGFAEGEAAMDIAIPACLLSVTALSALSPVVAPLVGRLLEALSNRLFPHSVISDLIHANLRDGIRRTASTAAPVILLVGVVVGLAGSSSEIDAGRREELRLTMTADLVARSDRPIGQEIAATPGVRAVSEELPLVIEVPDVASDGAVSYEPAEALAIDPVGYPRIHQANNVDGDWSDLRGDAMAVSPAYASRFDVGPGDVQRVRIDAAVRDLRVAAVLPRTLTGPDLVVPLTSTGPAETERLYFVQTNGLDPVTFESALQAAAGEAAQVTVTTIGDWTRTSTTSQRAESHNMILAILSLVTAYIAIAVVNAVVIAGADRGREFATARLTGLDRALVVRTALCESLVVVLIGTMLGVLAAATTLVGVAAGVSSIVGHTIFTVPWGLLASTILSATVLVSVASVLTALARTRSPAIEVARARE